MEAFYTSQPGEREKTRKVEEGGKKKARKAQKFQKAIAMSSAGRFGSLVLLKQARAGVRIGKGF